MYKRDQLFIDGKWDVAHGDSVITVISPHSEAEIGHAACAGPGDVDRAVQAARAASTARFTSAGPAPATRPMTASLCGEITEMTASESGWECGGAHFPSMKSWSLSYIYPSQISLACKVRCCDRR